MKKKKNIQLPESNSDKINHKNVRRIILKLFVILVITSFLFFILIRVTNKKLSELSGTVASILESNVKMVKLKEVAGCLYGAEASVRAYTIKEDLDYLLNYEKHVNCLNLKLDTLLLLSSQNKIVGDDKIKNNLLFFDQVDTLRELIGKRLDLFSEYIEIKTGYRSEDALLTLLHKVKINKPVVIDQSSNLLRVESVNDKIIPVAEHKIATPVHQVKEVEPKKSFFQRIFSAKKKKEEPITVVTPVIVPVVVPTVAPPIMPAISSDSIHKNLTKMITSTIMEEKLKEEKVLSNETNVSDQESVVMNQIVSLLNKMEQKELAEKSQRIDIATIDTTKRISFISNMFIVFGVIMTLMFLYFIYLDIRRANRFREQILQASEQATKKAEESTKVKETFLANMSHEIRTPMNAIIGFSDILSKRKLGESEKEYVKIIKSAGENLLTIINDILDISKIEAGMITFEENNFSVRDIFKSINGMMLEKAKEKNIDLLFTCDKNVPNYLFGDPTRLSQIIINLAGNAIKFTKTGSVKVTVEFLENKADYPEDLKRFENSDLLKFSVIDTGIGIPDDKLEYIFERFSQAESNTTRKYGGTGLGLSIAKQLVELQGGCLSAQSKFNEGSTFSFYIPYKKSTQVNVKIEEIEKKYNINDLKKLNILLVEDNNLNIRLILSLFSEYSLKVEVAENGSIGIEKIKKNDGSTLHNPCYDIILMDMEMPVMSGYEATTIIRKDLKNDIPIIAMTAHAMADQKDQCLSLGMNDYISKPINANLLFEKIHQLTHHAG